MFDRTSTKYSLSTGFTVWLYDWITQGEHDTLESVLYEKLSFSRKELVELDESQRQEKLNEKFDVSPAMMQRYFDVQKEIYVAKMQTPDGTVYEKEKVTAELIKSLPYIPEKGDELRTLIEEHISKKKPIFEKPTETLSVENA